MFDRTRHVPGFVFLNPMKSLNDLKGQKTALQMLNSYQTGKIPPLLIFHGPDGTGKLSAAERFVQKHLCRVQTACGTCSSCKKILKGEHPDFIVFPEDKVPIGDEKEPEVFSVRWLLRQRVIYNPHEGGFRFVLFPRSDLILNEAETALLKTLEEPPEHTRFIFIVRDLDLLKQTVVSRGVSIPFQRLSHENIRELTGLNQQETLDLLGGSMHHLQFLKSEFYQAMKEKIAEGLKHPLSLVRLEEWLHAGEKTKFRDLSEDAVYAFDEILDIFSLLILKGTERHEKRNAVARAVFRFKEDMHQDIPGLHPYLISRLFQNLSEILFHESSASVL